MSIKKMVEIINRIFPNLLLIEDGEFTDPEQNNFAPPEHVDWYYIIEKLKENGLSIIDTKGD